MVDHVGDGAGDAGVVECEEAKDAEAKVGHGGVGDELLDVGLDPADEASVEDADDAERGDDGCELDHCSGDEGEDEAEHAVRAELQEDARQDDRAGRGGFRVGEWEPGVDGEEGDLDGEAREEREQEP